MANFDEIIGSVFDGAIGLPSLRDYALATAYRVAVTDGPVENEELDILKAAAEEELGMSAGHAAIAYE